jgi:hypothetical protein
MGIEDKRRQGGCGIALGGWNPLHHGLQNSVDARSFLRRALEVLFRVQPQLRIYLLNNPFHIRRGQINLVDDGDNFQVVFHGQIEIGQRLGLNSLGRVDEQQSAFAGCERPGNLVRKIHMAGCVDEVERVILTVLAMVRQRDGLTLDGYAALPFDIHVIENLVFIGARVRDSRKLD